MAAAGISGGAVATVVLRASTSNLLDDVERAVDDGVNAYKVRACRSAVVPFCWCWLPVMLLDALLTCRFIVLYSSSDLPGAQLRHHELCPAVLQFQGSCFRQGINEIRAALINQTF